MKFGNKQYNLIFQKHKLITRKQKYKERRLLHINCKEGSTSLVQWSACLTNNQEVRIQHNLETSLGLEGGPPSLLN